MIGLYLPQYHPIPENDRWWGKGFTEWTNVARARPLFRGHVQPQLPGRLGFYDLRVPETRAAQADLAHRAGLDGFCYWHYWFGGGSRLLERPLREVVESGEPEFGFCIGWANQSWTGVWHGAPNRVLIEQRYPSADDAVAHFQYLLPMLRDRRYLTTSDGSPIIYVQSPSLLPTEQRIPDVWRTLAVEAELPGLYLVGELVRGYAPGDLGFDAWAQPVGTAFPLRRRWQRGPARASYRAVVEAYDLSDPNVHPTLLTNWDNTPRSGRRGVVLTDRTSDDFVSHARRVLRAAAERPSGPRLVFVKSWNEWAEGNYLEPDARDGDLYIRLLASEVERARGL